MEPTQGAIIDPASAVPDAGQGAGQGASAVVDPNASPASSDGQGAVPEDVQHQLRTTQGAVDSLRAQLLQQQQMMQQMMQQREPQQTPAPTTNPYDPQTQSTEWWRHEIRMGQESAVQKAQQGMMQVIAQAAQQAAEQQWQARHPETSVDMVKMYARMNMGFEPQTDKALDMIYQLMTMPNQVQTAQTNAVNQFYSQARQPVNPATPLRGGPAPAAPGKVSFDDVLRQYAQNPEIENTWSPEFRAAFEQELGARNALIKKGRL